MIIAILTKSGQAFIRQNQSIYRNKKGGIAAFRLSITVLHAFLKEKLGKKIGNRMQCVYYI